LGLVGLGGFDAEGGVAGAGGDVGPVQLAQLPDDLRGVHTHVRVLRMKEERGDRRGKKGEGERGRGRGKGRGRGEGERGRGRGEGEGVKRKVEVKKCDTLCMHLPVLVGVGTLMSWWEGRALVGGACIGGRGMHWWEGSALVGEEVLTLLVLLER